MQNVRYSRPQCIVWCVCRGGGGGAEMSVKGRGWVGASVKDTNIRCSHPEPVAGGGGGGNK